MHTVKQNKTLHFKPIQYFQKTLQYATQDKTAPSIDHKNAKKVTTTSETISAGNKLRKLQ